MDGYAVVSNDWWILLRKMKSSKFNESTHSKSLREILFGTKQTVLVDAVLNSLWVFLFRSQDTPNNWGIYKEIFYKGTSILQEKQAAAWRDKEGLLSLWL